MDGLVDPLNPLVPHKQVTEGMVAGCAAPKPRSRRRRAKDKKKKKPYQNRKQVQEAQGPRP